MYIMGIAVVILLIVIGLCAVIAGLVMSETFFIVIGILLFMMAFILWLSFKDKVSNPFKD